MYKQALFKFFSGIKEERDLGWVDVGCRIPFGGMQTLLESHFQYLPKSLSPLFRCIGSGVCVCFVVGSWLLFVGGCCLFTNTKPITKPTKRTLVHDEHRRLSNNVGCKVASPHLPFSTQIPRLVMFLWSVVVACCCCCSCCRSRERDKQ